MSDAIDRVRSWQAGVAVVMVAVIAHAAALGGTFVYDDIHSISGNPGVRTLGNAWQFFVDPTLFSGNGSAMYRPVLLLTFAVDWWLGGGSPLPFKVTNVALHAATALLSWRLVRGHGARPLPAVLVALAFAVHPLAGETINLVSSRSEGLLVFGLVLALLGHRAWLRGRTAGAGIAFLGAVVACGSKETGAVVPALLLVQEWLATGDARWSALSARWRGIALRLLPATLLVACYLLVRRELLGQATATLAGRSGVDPLFGATRDLTTQLATMGVLLPRTLWQMLVPCGLSLDPPVPYQRTWTVAAVVGWLSLAGLLAATVGAGRRAPLRVLGSAIAVATALPWVIIPLNVPLAEHRLYGALFGGACVLAGLQDRLVALAAATRWRRVLLVGAGAWAIWAIGASAVRATLFADPAALWRSAIAVHPRSFRAHWGLGTTQLERGLVADAERSLARACTLAKGFRAGRSSWVDALLQLPGSEGWPYRALVVAEELVRQRDADPYYRLQLANAQLQVGMLAASRERLLQAEATVLSCLQIAPPKALVFRLAAQCRSQLGEPAAALAHFDAAIARGLDGPALRAERSEVLRALGRGAEAERELRRAMTAAPMDGTVRAVLARRSAAAPR